MMFNWVVIKENISAFFILSIYIRSNNFEINAKANFDFVTQSQSNFYF